MSLLGHCELNVLSFFAARHQMRPQDCLKCDGDLLVHNARLLQSESASNYRTALNRRAEDDLGENARRASQVIVSATVFPRGVTAFRQRLHLQHGVNSIASMLQDSCSCSTLLAPIIVDVGHSAGTALPRPLGEKRPAPAGRPIPAATDFRASKMRQATPGELGVPKSSSAPLSRPSNRLKLFASGEICRHPYLPCHAGRAPAQQDSRAVRRNFSCCFPDSSR